MFTRTTADFITAGHRKATDVLADEGQQGLVRRLLEDGHILCAVRLGGCETAYRVDFRFVPEPQFGPEGYRLDIHIGRPGRYRASYYSEVAPDGELNTDIIWQIMRDKCDL